MIKALQQLATTKDLQHIHSERKTSARSKADADSLLKKEACKKCIEQLQDTLTAEQLQKLERAFLYCCQWVYIPQKIVGD